MNVDRFRAGCSNAVSWARANWLALFLGLILLGFSLSSLYRHLIGLTGAAGVYFLARRPRELFRHQSVRTLCLLFACIWLPMLVALIDADNFRGAAQATMRYAFYFLFGIAVIALAERARNFSAAVFWVVGAVLGFWLFDGLVQLALGVDLFGKPIIDHRLTGMFPGVRLGLMLAIFAPIIYEVVRRLSARSRWAWALLIPYAMAILFGGSRVSWMLLAVGTVGYYALVYSVGHKPDWRKLAVRAAIVLVCVGAVVSQVDWLRNRMTAVAGVFSGDYETTNHATSLRVPLWRTGMEIVRQHPINGVGARNFGSVYQAHDPERSGEKHDQPHLFILEIAAETGLIGLAGFFLMVFLIARRLWILRRTRDASIPWGLTAFLAAFPLSSALSFFANFMAGLIWFSIVLFLATSSGRKSAAA